MLNKIIFEGWKVYCSDATEQEIQEMFESVRDQGMPDAPPPSSDDEERMIFSFRQIGPVPVLYKDRRYILWGSTGEVRFYTQEEFESLTEDQPDM